MLPRPTIEAFDTWLAQRSLRFEAVVVGGSALALLDVITRETQDVDVLDPELPIEVVHAAREFATHMRGAGTVLADDWLNNRPIQLGTVLPIDWRLRLRIAFEGVAIRLHTLGRADLLKSKLFALCDRGTDLDDCLALAPTRLELVEAAPWLATQDTNPMWPDHVRATLEDLGRRLGHGV